MLCRRAWLHSDVCECHTGPRRATALTASSVPKGPASPLLSLPSQALRREAVLVVTHRHRSTSPAKISPYSCFSTITLQSLLHTYVEVIESHILPFLSQTSWQTKSQIHMALQPPAWLDPWSPDAPVSSEPLPALTQQYGKGLYHILLPSVQSSCWVKEMSFFQYRWCTETLGIPDLVANWSIWQSALQTSGSARGRGLAPSLGLHPRFKAVTDAH